MKKSKMTYELFEVARLILDKEDRLSIVIRHLEAEQRPDALLARIHTWRRELAAS